MFIEFILVLTNLSIDKHNRISTSDLRLLRRISRDAQHRNSDAQRTIKMWKKVRAGEQKNIFPYQENADVIFNSSFIYEIPVLKNSVEALLFAVDRNSEEYFEAKRLLKFLDFFLGYNDKVIPNDSIVREFVGGSCLDVG
jgi:uridine kinase